MAKEIRQKIKDLPQKPGVYIFKDSQGIDLYVGKAIKLKNRVSSYFARSSDRASGRMTGRIQHMISQIADLDYVVTDNETESLLLENNLIKQIKPKYNVRLRDDKNYIFIKINVQDEIPTIKYERKLSNKNARYFGPYTQSLSIKETLRLVRKIFPYCANSKVGNRPCFYYHIGKCPGVCIGKISPEEYRANYINKIMSFLQGKQTQILKELQTRMKLLAAKKKFEQAAKVRNQIFALNRALDRQKVVYAKKIDQDVFSLYTDGVSCVNLFIIREGKLIQKENFILENTKGLSVSEILQDFLERYYLEASSVPKEILLPVALTTPPLIPPHQGEENDIPPPRWGRLGGGGPKTPKIIVPIRGPKLQLIKLGEQNAKQYLESISDKKLLEEAKALASLKELQRVLALPQLPGRIEAFDISNIQGRFAVSSMVVFDFARPKKEDYRKFKIKLKDTPNDFAMMSEVLSRRFRRSAINSWPLPDLILIDGGKGQLNAALSAMRKYEIPVLGLAKRLEEIYLPGKKNPLTLPANSIALFLLQRIRDEAHRFAITFHRKLRSKAMRKSKLDEILGVGEKTKRKLLESFGSITKIKNAGVGEIANITGTKLAENIKASL